MENKLEKQSYEYDGYTTTVTKTFNKEGVQTTQSEDTENNWIELKKQRCR